jgi:ArsR family transcriptional regulator, arsenate/arsenite/antimonite-responsive transcriptional repressor / arsenate reductase (thioredoxin)
MQQGAGNNLFPFLAKYLAKEDSLSIQCNLSDSVCFGGEGRLAFAGAETRGDAGAGRRCGQWHGLLSSNLHLRDSVLFNISRIMEQSDAAALFALLGHPGRLGLFRLLMRRAPQSVRPGEMTRVLQIGGSTLSAYLAALEAGGLVQAERQGRAIHYRAMTERAGALIEFLYADCCRGRPDLCPAPATLKEGEILRVIFICTGNSGRSIIAETLVNALGKGRFRAYSAGTHPAKAPHPQALDLLARNGHDIRNLRSKPLSEFQQPDAPRMDFVFTLCDAAANEECAPWPGGPISAHWGLPDPSLATGTEAERALAYAECYRALRRRIEAFVALPLETLDRMALQRHVDDITER